MTEEKIIERNPKIHIVRHEIECKVVDQIPNLASSDRVDEVRRCTHGNIQIVRQYSGYVRWEDLCSDSEEYNLARVALDKRTPEQKRLDVILTRLDKVEIFLTGVCFLAGMIGAVFLFIIWQLGLILLGVSAVAFVAVWVVASQYEKIERRKKESFDW